MEVIHDLATEGVLLNRYHPLTMDTGTCLDPFFRRRLVYNSDARAARSRTPRQVWHKARTQQALCATCLEPDDVCREDSSGVMHIAQSQQCRRCERDDSWAEWARDY